MKKLMVVAALVLSIAAGMLLVPKAPKINASSIVRLYDDEGSYMCSGTVISDIYVITAAHCLVYPGGLTIRTDSGKHIAIASNRFLNQRGDLGIIQGDFSNFPKSSLEADARTIIKDFQYDRIAICGYPWGGKLLCVPYVVQKTFDSMGELFFHMAGLSYAYPGMSGGPAFDLDTGKVIGTITGGNGGVIYVAPSISIMEATRIISR